MPVIYKEDIDLQDVKLIGCHNIKKNDTKHSQYGVHFYKWDDCGFNQRVWTSILKVMAKVAAANQNQNTTTKPLTL